MEKLKEWLTSVVAGIVTRPESVNVSVLQDDKGILLTLNVAKEDTGRVLGKKGSIAEALRTIARASGSLLDTRVSMTVDAPNSTFRLRREENGQE